MITIQINTDNSIEGAERHKEYYTTQISEGLARFEEHITRVEVHLKDENGKKEGVNDKTCTLEARLKGMQPIAVSSQADSVPKALAFALDKVSAAITTVVGKRAER